MRKEQGVGNGPVHRSVIDSGLSLNYPSSSRQLETIKIDRARGRTTHFLEL